jgi:hypothetical protein
MEFGRKVYLSLHHQPPAPASTDRPVGIQIVTTLSADGNVELRVLFSPYHLGPALPLR